MTSLQQIASDLSYEVLLRRIREKADNPKLAPPIQQTVIKPVYFSPSDTEEK